MSPALVKHLSAETLRVYQLRSLRLLIHAIEATISDPVNHIFLDLQSDAVLGLVSKRTSMLYGHLNVMLGQNAASTQPANSASLLRRNGHYLSCIRLAGFHSAQKSATHITFKAAKKLTDLFPRVQPTDAILLIVQCHILSHDKMRLSSRPMD